MNATKIPKIIRFYLGQIFIPAKQPFLANDKIVFPNKRTAEIAVIYLARGATKHELSAIPRFIDSYKKYDAGIEHKLYVILKGYSDLKTKHSVVKQFENISTVFIETNDLGFDIGSYLKASKILNEEKLFFLNTNSTIQTNQWLRKIYQASVRPDVGIVGCFGSYNFVNFTKYPKVQFPNPHIRTNAFMIDRSLFISLTKGLRITDKESAWNFESGIESLTRRIEATNLKAIVVDDGGLVYEKEFWMQSATFHSKNQVGSIVHDNQTSVYAEANVFNRLKMQYIAWGQYGKINTFFDPPDQYSSRPTKILLPIKNDKAVIVVPFHKSVPSADEENSLKNTLQVMSSWDVVLILPLGISASWYRSFMKKNNFEFRIEILEEGFMGSIEKYNQMCFTPLFYEKFEQYECLLIAHLDAWIFKDVLADWIAKGFDYLGAPLFLSKRKLFLQSIRPDDTVARIYSRMLPFGGNGGLSLRNVAAHLRVTRAIKGKVNILLIWKMYAYLISKLRFFHVIKGSQLLIRLISNPLKFRNRYMVYEDLMLSICIPIVDRNFYSAPVKSASKFCIDYPYLEYLLKTGGLTELPFGIHGWIGKFEAQELVEISKTAQSKSSAGVITK